MKVSTIVLNLVFCTVAFVQFVILIRNTIDSTDLYTEMTIAPLDGKPLPLKISLCVSPSYNQTELENAGYGNYMDYQHGYSIYNYSLFGWAGHTKDGNKLYDNALILQEKMILWRNLSDIVISVTMLENDVFHRKATAEDIDDMVQTSRAFFSNYCFILKPSTNFVQMLGIYMKPNLNISEIEIRIDDVSMFSNRQIVDHSLNHQGVRITSNNLDKQTNKMYSVELIKEVYVEDDMSKNCYDYDADPHYDYNKCDTKYGLNIESKMFGPNFKPLWAMDNLSLVTSEPTSTDVELSNHYNLVAGILLSDCKIPCTVIKTRTKYLGETAYYYPGVSIIFKNDMQVEGGPTEPKL